MNTCRPPSRKEAGVSVLPGAGAVLDAGLTADPLLALSSLDPCGGWNALGQGHPAELAAVPCPCACVAWHAQTVVQDSSSSGLGEPVGVTHPSESR